MNARASLGDRLAFALIEHGQPLACERLARLLGVRTLDVRRALRADERFERFGSGRGSRWRLVLPPASARDGLGRIPSDGLMYDDGLDIAERLRALERRVANLERQLIEPRSEP